MKKRSCIAIATLLGVALSSASAFAQNGPGALNYGAGSNPQTGGQPASAQSAASTAPRRSGVLVDRAPGVSPAPAGVAGPAGNNYGAGTNPQTGK
jgi:hypothetical protein